MLRNMWDPGILDHRHFFSPRHFFLQRCKVLGELTTEKMLSAWVSVDCGSKWHFLPGNFSENTKCAWERADAKNTSLPGTFMDILKVRGIVRMLRFFFCQVIWAQVLSIFP